jgi:peptide-methionine (S)-S-oxide reductase
MLAQWGVEHLFNKHYSHLPQFSAISGYTGGDPSSKSPSRYLVDPGSSIHRFRDLDRRPRRGNAKALCCLDAGADCVAYRQVCSGTTGHAEAVRVGYQKGSVGYGELVEFFYRTHDPTTKDSQGPDRGTREWPRVESDRAIPSERRSCSRCDPIRDVIRDEWMGRC